MLIDQQLRNGEIRFNEISNVESQKDLDKLLT
jgi:hypothetical protein